VFSTYSRYEFRENSSEDKMAAVNGLDKMSYTQLLALQERVEEAIAAKRSEDAQATKEQLRAMAEKAGFDIKDLFGKRGSPKGSGVAKYRNPKDTSQTWTGRGRKPNWLVEAVKKGAKIEAFVV
jgi:DNA-binding protein H-NS